MARETDYVVICGNSLDVEWVVFGANRGPRPSVDGPTPMHSLAVFGANSGSRPPTDDPPHAKLPAVLSKGHILDSIILLI